MDRLNLLFSCEQTKCTVFKKWEVNFKERIYRLHLCLLACNLPILPSLVHCSFVTMLPTLINGLYVCLQNANKNITSCQFLHMVISSALWEQLTGFLRGCESYHVLVINTTVWTWSFWQRNVITLESSHLLCFGHFILTQTHCWVVVVRDRVGSNSPAMEDWLIFAQTTAMHLKVCLGEVRVCSSYAVTATSSCSAIHHFIFCCEILFFRSPTLCLGLSLYFLQTITVTIVST